MQRLRVKPVWDVVGVPQMGLNGVYQRIFSGTMPAMYGDDPPDHAVFYRSYLNTYLGRDIRDLTQVANEMAFLDFMTVVAARTSHVVQYEEMAREVGISAPTAKSWLSVLVSSGIVCLVRPYSNNALKRVVKAPPLHFLDTGLAAYLLKWDNAQTLERGAAAGAFFESYVFSEIYKSYLNAGAEPPVYYYRDRDKREIGLLIYSNGILCPIEIKKTASPSANAVRHFKTLAPVKEPERFGALGQLKCEIGTGAVICMANDRISHDWRTPALPVGLSQSKIARK